MYGEHLGSGAIGRGDPDDEPRRGGFGSLPALVRYPIAIALNLGFLAAVAAGFYYLFQMGGEIRESRESQSVETASAERSGEGDAAPSRAASRPDARSGPTTLEDPAPTPSPAVALTRPSAPSDTPAPNPASLTAPAPSPIETAASAEGAPDPLDDPLADDGSDPPPAASADPEASLERERADAWARAGALAARLTAELPCGSFALSANDDGSPFLTAEVPSRRDVGLVRPAIETAMGEAHDISVGLGCTTDLGGGYLALSDAGDTARLVTANELTTQVRAVLPGPALCDGLGLVARASRGLSARLAELGTPSVWVIDAGSPSLCQEAPEGWRLRDAAADARAGVLIYTGDVLVAEVGRSAEIVASVTAPAEGRPADPPPEPRLSPPEPQRSDEVASRVLEPLPDAAATELNDEPAQAGPRRVYPVAGPLPAPIPQLGANETVSVDVAFMVDADGAASDFLVVGASNFDPALVAAAVRIVENSVFPAPSGADGGRYRGQYRVMLNGEDAEDIATPPAAARNVTTGGSSEAQSSGRVMWVRGPTEADFDEVYPERARRRGRGGEAQLTCRIAVSGALDCDVMRVSPGGLRFGDAALALTERLIAAPQLSDGSPSAGHRFTFPITFTVTEREPTPPPAAPSARAAGAPLSGGTVLWERALRGSDFDDLYPARARAFGRIGAAELSCVVLETRRLRCTLAAEEPRGWRFGRAAIDLSQRLIAAPVLSNGQSAVGHEFTLPFAFRLGDE